MADAVGLQSLVQQLVRVDYALDVLLDEAQVDARARNPE